MGACPNNCAAAVAMADGPATSARAAASPQRMYSPRVVVFRSKRNQCGQFQILLARPAAPALVMRPSFPRSKKENQRQPLSAFPQIRLFSGARNRTRPLSHSDRQFAIHCLRGCDPPSPPLSRRDARALLSHVFVSLLR